MLYLTTCSTHFIYGYRVSDVWLRTTRQKTHHCHIKGYLFQEAARDLLYSLPETGQYIPQAFLHQL